MRIAYISTIRNAPWGGSEELWYKSAERAIESGHELGIFVYMWPDEPAKLTALKKRGATIFKRERYFSRVKRLIHKAIQIASIDSLFLNPYKSVVNFKPDRIVITDGATYYAANDKWLTAILKNYRKKYIIVCQGNGSYSFPDSRSEALLLFNNAQSTVFVAENNMQQTFHQLAERFSRTVIIQNPVNLPFFKILDFPVYKDDTIHCAMVGRLAVAEKGQDVVISIMSQEFWMRSNVKIHIYGAGNDLQYLKNLTAYYNVSDKIIFEGHADIQKVWQTCQVLLMPSISEGTPLVLLEAMVLGRICIVTNVGGNSEWILDNENGFLAEASTPELFSKKMKEAIIKRDLWPEISVRAHSDALKKMDSDPGKSLLDQIVTSPV